MHEQVPYKDVLIGREIEMINRTKDWEKKNVRFTQVKNQNQNLM